MKQFIKKNRKKKKQGIQPNTC